MPGNGKPKGFSLIELMMVVAILSVLVAIAIPQFQAFLAKSKRAEGILVLEGTYKVELAYFAEYDRYGYAYGALRQEVGADNLRYYHPGAFGVFPNGDRSSFVAILLGNLDKDGNIFDDTLCIYGGTDWSGDCSCSPKSDSPPGQVIVVRDDITERYCYE